ncbi:MAG: hypothetical protein U0169_21525 [Polyangiaceae bacterium]
MSYEPPPPSRSDESQARDRESSARPRAGAPWSVLWFDPPPDETTGDVPTNDD